MARRVLPLSLLACAMSLVAIPAAASTYSAALESAAPAKVIDRDISWTCKGATCSGATSESRPMVLCQGLAKQAGRVARFSADGRSFTAAELDRCNASAKGASATKVANR